MGVYYLKASQEMLFKMCISLAQALQTPRLCFQICAHEMIRDYECIETEGQTTEQVQTGLLIDEKSGFASSTTKVPMRPIIQALEFHISAVLVNPRKGALN